MKITMKHEIQLTLASVIATKLHFYLRFYQSGLSYSRGLKAIRKNTKKHNSRHNTNAQKEKIQIMVEKKGVSPNDLNTRDNRGTVGPLVLGGGW